MARQVKTTKQAASAGKASTGDQIVYKTKVETVPIIRLVPAAWNYKFEISPEDRAKLVASIKEDGSAGVLGVREIKGGKLEVIDGNHRLEVLIELNAADVRVENFGPITKAQAVIIARKRNAQYAKADPAKWGVLLKEVVAVEASLAAAAAVLPDTEEELQATIRMLEYDWSKEDGDGKPDEKKGPKSYNNAVDFVALSIQLPRPLFNRWEMGKKAMGVETDVQFVDRLLALIETGEKSSA